MAKEKELLYKSVKIKIFPTHEQEEVLLKISQLCCWLWNAALKQRQDLYWQRRIFVNFFQQCGELKNLKQELPEFTGPYSHTLVETLKTLDGAYKSFYELVKKDSQARPPGYKSEKFFCTFQYPQGGRKIIDNRLILFHKINCTPLEFELEEGALEIIKDKKIKLITLFRSPAELSLAGQYYVTITYEVERPEVKLMGNPKIAIVHLAAHQQTILFDDGQKFELVELKNWRPDEFWAKPLSSIISRADKCTKGSRRWKKLQALKRKIQQKQMHQMKNFQHVRSRQIIDLADVFVTSKFSVKKMAQAKPDDHPGIKKGHKTIFNTGLIFRVYDYLRYKAALEGKEFILVPSKDISRKCVKCGRILPEEKGNGSACSCGWNRPRHVNACLNMAKEFYRTNRPDRISALETWIKTT